MEEFPLEVKFKWRSLFIFAIFFMILFLIGLLGILIEPVMAIFALVMLLVSLFMFRLALSNRNRIALSVDKKGISCFPSPKRTIGPVKWSDIREIDSHTVNSGRTTTTYFRVQVKDLNDYLTVGQKDFQERHKATSRFSGYLKDLVGSENAVIDFPLGQLMIKEQELLEIAIKTWNENKNTEI